MSFGVCVFNHFGLYRVFDPQTCGRGQHIQRLMYTECVSFFIQDHYKVKPTCHLSDLHIAILGA